VLVVWVEAMDCEIGCVGVVEDIIQRGDDWVADVLEKGVRGSVEGCVGVYCY